MVYCALFAHSEYKVEVFALLLYLKYIGLSSTQLYWSYSLLEKERIVMILTIVVAVVINNKNKDSNNQIRDATINEISLQTN